MQAGASPFTVTLRTLTLRDPLRWLAAGWRDFQHAPRIGLFFGSCFMAMGWALLKVFENAPVYTLALAAGFLLTGPILCLGLYRVSQCLERGDAPTLVDAMLTWRHHTAQLAIFGFVLLVLELLWSRSTLVVFALSFQGMPDFKGSLLALLDPANKTFIIAWLALGGLFATLIFAFSVVAIPMLLDGAADAISAALTSVRLVLTQPLVMMCWAALVAVIVALAMLPGFAGLLVAAPVLGHASWHAYRAAVVAGAAA